MTLRRLVPAWALLLVLLAQPALAAGPPKVEKVVSPGGIEAWLIEDRSVPLVAIEFAFRAGAALDPADKVGLSRLAASVLDEGAGKLSSQEFQGRLEDLASQVRFDAGLDSVTGSVKMLKERAGDTLDLVKLALTEPRFDADAVERVRQQILVSLAREAEQPGAIARRAWFRAAFPDHPYGRGSRGTVDSVARIGVDDLKGWVKQRLTRDALVIGVAGDVTAADLGPLLDRAFGGLPATAERPQVLDVLAKVGGDVMVIERRVPQTVILWGHEGIRREDPDFYAAFVLNYVLGGGGFSSRLTDEIREKRGLAYGVSSYLANLDRATLWMGQTATVNAKAEEVVALVRAEWTRLQRGAPTEEELANAKTYLIGSFALGLDSTNRIAGLLLTMQLDHLGIDYLEKRNKLIEAVTPEQAKRVLERVLDAAKLNFVLVGQPVGVKATRPPPGDS